MKVYKVGLPANVVRTGRHFPLTTVIVSSYDCIAVYSYYIMLSNAEIRLSDLYFKLTKEQYKQASVAEKKPEGWKLQRPLLTMRLYVCS